MRDTVLAFVLGMMFATLIWTLVLAVDMWRVGRNSSR